MQKRHSAMTVRCRTCPHHHAISFYAGWITPDIMERKAHALPRDRVPDESTRHNLYLIGLRITHAQ